jgi:2-keto-4-pentenoate hydratase
MRDPLVRHAVDEQMNALQRRLDGGATRLGWKAGMGTAAAMAKLGTDAPLFGHLTDAGLLPTGATARLDGWGQPTLEPEIALRMGRDLPPGADRAAVVDAIDAAAPAIELVDLAGAGTSTIAEILAGNIFHRHVLLGDFAPVAGEAQLAAIRMDVHRGGGDVQEGIDPALVLGDLATIVGHLADALAAAGQALRAGDVVITGSAIAAIPVRPGDTVEVAALGSRVAVGLA